MFDTVDYIEIVRNYLVDQNNSCGMQRHSVLKYSI